MAYPFGAPVTLDDLVKRLKAEYSCREVAGPTLVGPRGPTKLRIIVRDVNGSPRPCVLPEPDTVTPSVLRSICIQLGIDPVDFGYVLSTEAELADDDADSAGGPN